MLNTISFSAGGISSFPFYNFLMYPFFCSLQPFTAAENLKIAGDNAGRRRILTTLGRGTHITRNVCSKVGETHFTSDRVGENISLGICVPLPGVVS